MYDSEDLAFQLVKHSDTRAFEWLFRKYYQPLCLFANRYVADLSAAEEIVSGAFIFLWDRREDIFITTSFRSYMLKMVQNRCINHLRHKKVENAYLKYLRENNLLEDHAFQEKLFESYYNKQIASAIRSAIDSLPEKCREIFILSRYENLSYREIASRLSVSTKTVENQVSIALHKLRRILKDIITTVVL